MSAEAPENPNTEGPFDLSSAVSDFISPKFSESVIAARKAEELRLKREEKVRIEGMILAAGNSRGREIVEKSGIREILEQARAGLSQFYPSATIEERENIERNYVGYDPSKKTYYLRLAWKPDPDTGPIKNIWDTFFSPPRWEEKTGNSEGFDYIQISCTGWELERSLVVRAGLDFIGDNDWGRRNFSGNEWQDSEGLEHTILAAIKKPRHVTRHFVSISSPTKRPTWHGE